MSNPLQMMKEHFDRLDALSDMTKTFETVYKEIYQGRNIVVIHTYSGERPGWFCGYVEVFDIESFKACDNDWDIPIDVVGGITFRGDIEGSYCIGFDTNHADHDGIETLDQMINEVKNVVNQLKELDNGRNTRIK